MLITIPSKVQTREKEKQVTFVGPLYMGIHVHSFGAAGGGTQVVCLLMSVQSWRSPGDAGAHL